jgi:hypothetical protein
MSNKIWRILPVGWGKKRENFPGSLKHERGDNRHNLFNNRVGDRAGAIGHDGEREGEDDLVWGGARRGRDRGRRPVPTGLTSRFGLANKDTVRNEDH